MKRFLKCIKREFWIKSTGYRLVINVINGWGQGCFAFSKVHRFFQNSKTFLLILNSTALPYRISALGRVHGRLHSKNFPEHTYNILNGNIRFIQRRNVFRCFIPFLFVLFSKHFAKSPTLYDYDEVMGPSVKILAPGLFIANKNHSNAFLLFILFIFMISCLKIKNTKKKMRESRKL